MAPIAQVAEPGVIFGELSALLNQPHTADVRTMEESQFHVADAAALLGQDPVALLYIATVLARRLDDTNQVFLELKNQLQAGEPLGFIDNRRIIERHWHRLCARWSRLYHVSVCLTQVGLLQRGFRRASFPNQSP